MKTVPVGAGAVFLLFQQLCNIDGKTGIDSNGNIIREGIQICIFFLLKTVYIYNFPRWIDDPVFPDAGSTVFEKLYAVSVLHHRIRLRLW